MTPTPSALGKPIAKNARTKRFLDDRAPKLVEDAKTAIFLESTTSNRQVHDALHDLFALKKPEATFYSKKNTILPFDDVSSLEFFAKKSDASLFAYGYDSKKRPNSILLGRFFDHQVLDMIELHIKSFTKISEFKNTTVTGQGKPCFLFQGTLFDQSEPHRQLRNLLLDFFHGEEADTAYLNGLEHVIAVTAFENGQVMLRVYGHSLRKSGSKLPRVELEEVGPRLDLELGRTKFAPESVARVAYKKPKALKVKKVKNVSRDELGDKFGRIHNPRQDLKTLQTRKMKALKKDPVAPATQESA